MWSRRGKSIAALALSGVVAACGGDDKSKQQAAAARVRTEGPTIIQNWVDAVNRRDWVAACRYRTALIHTCEQEQRDEFDGGRVVLRTRPNRLGHRVYAVYDCKGRLLARGSVYADTDSHGHL